MRAPVAAGVALAWGLAACGPSTSPDDHWFRAPELSASRFNHFSCATCHASEPGSSPAARHLPGGTLHDVAARPRWWGGQITTLRDAVNVCMVFFMRGQPLSPDDERGLALSAYLQSISPSREAPPVPLTVPGAVTRAPGGGDAGRGASSYATACEPCHGARSTGVGKLDPSAITLPEGTASYARDYPFATARLVVTDKVRHSPFFEVGGVMPFYSMEVLPDADLADILAYLGL